MNDILSVCAEKFLSLPFVDSSIALKVYGASGHIDEVKEKLVKLYGENATASVDGHEVRVADITAADEIVMPPLAEFDKPRYNVCDAQRVILRLMRKDGGCPWDSVQTHESIRGNMIEEAYEAVDAIDKRDLENMREEFGDVLLQSLLQSAIAKREGEFDFDDVCDGLCKKLIGRHTFIFGGDSAKTADDALNLWDKNKSVEKHYDGVKAQLLALPDDFPSLLRCQKVYKKIKKSGARLSPERDLQNALENKDYAAAIDACASLLYDEGKDAEVELNRIVRQKTEKL